MSDWLAGEIKSRGLSNTVFSHGRRPLEDMPRIYAEHNILLVSLKKDDALKHVLPSKMQTYLAAGQPILASGDGEIADTIKSSGAGLVSPADDSTELATNALIFLKMNSTQLNEMGQRGKLFYDINFNKINLIKKLEEYLSAEHRR